MTVSALGNSIKNPQIKDFKVTEGLKKYESKSVWKVLWDDSDPSAFVYCTKSKLVFVKSYTEQRTVNCFGYLNRVSNHKADVFLLDHILQYGSQVSISFPF